ncbi:MAG: zinc-ribbon and DUF3426 domain-containing protein [Candidatus Thiodiazotropha sp.]
MLTQCPHCLTLFRVGPEHLKAAAGQVRCCRCHQVFNALQRLHESPTSFTNPSDASPEQSETQTSAQEYPDTPTEPVEERPEEKGNSEDQPDCLCPSETTSQRSGIHAPPDDDLDRSTEPTQESLLLREEQELWPDFTDPPNDDGFSPMPPGRDSAEKPDGLIEGILEQDDGLDPEPDYFAADSESQMSELLDQDSSSILLPDTEEPSDGQYGLSDNIVTFSSSVEAPESMEDTPYGQDDAESILKDEATDEEWGRPDRDSVPAFYMETKTSPGRSITDDHAFNFEAEITSRKPRSKWALLWFLGCLLLSLPLAGQLAWQFRGDLIQHDAGRQALNLLCRIVDCKVPVRQALDKVIIQGRNLSTHPDKPNTLFLQVNIINTAAFEQPFPRLILSLYNDKGNLVARRTFLAKDYLPPEFEQQGVMPKDQPILVEMELVDPGKEVTGFSFDFF